MKLITILLTFLLFHSCKPNFTGNDHEKQKELQFEGSNLLTDKSGLTLSYAVLKTIHGPMKIRFFPQKAPNSIKRILHLINSGFYDGLAFHRVIKNFIIQAGDPTKLGNGGSGIKLKQEFNNIPHVKGTLALARGKEVDSADSQFYIALSTLPHLDKKYTVIGQVTGGLDVLSKIVEGDKITSFTFNPNSF